MSHAFGKSRRITDTADFSAVLRHGVKGRLSLAKVYLLRTDEGPGRLGLGVSKKVAKLANDRNYMKRRLREWYRTHPELVASCDLVILVTGKFAKADFPALQSELESWLKNPPKSRGQRHGENRERQSAPATCRPVDGKPDGEADDKKEPRASELREPSPSPSEPQRDE